MELSTTPWEGALRATAGTALAGDSPGSFSLEPELRANWSTIHRTSLAAFVAKPFSTFEPWTVSRTALSQRWVFHQDGYVAGRAGAALMAWDLNRWNVDGPLVRTLFWVEAETILSPSWRLLVRLSPFTQFSRYAQRGDGRSLPRFGTQERGEISWRRGIVEATLGLALEQRRESRWKNAFDFYQQVRVDLSPDWRIGVGHAFATESLDETTGLSHGVRWLDARDNRIALFLEGRV